MLKGKVIKAAGGFFTVRDESGGEHVCRARGMLKRGKSGLMVGDWVLFEPFEATSFTAGDEGIIEELMPRANRLYRPPVANVDQLIAVMSLKEPECDWQLVSRMLVLAEKENLAAVLCLNKTDLIEKKELDDLTSRLEFYPYPILYTSAVNKTGLDQLENRLSGQCSVFAGPSGVGKSSLLNVIQPGLSLQTGIVSEKIKRGRHTTRQAELLLLNNGGSVVDTPGFTRLDFSDLEADYLADYFPEFDPLRGRCGFRNCRHISEPECAVRQEISKSINSMRYDHYKYFIQELGKQEAF